MDRMELGNFALEMMSNLDLLPEELDITRAAFVVEYDDGGKRVIGLRTSDSDGLANVRMLHAAALTEVRAIIGSLTAEGDDE